MRLLPRFARINSKSEVWPGGPQVGQVIQAQLNPSAGGAPAAPTAQLDDGDDAPQDTTARDLLLLLR
jgi:hypothetical protein